MQHAEPDPLLTPAVDVGPLAIGPGLPTPLRCPLHELR